ncbi:Rho-associated protein kinase 2 [Hypsibius exemplaris]|uniref:Rho-associated protein kinase 2 n=1 Tax=Hypsibius exemplaris TaxID=2072580 RepID=A0A9X6NNY2_HYPEX|nr:Rho-associated protein kinase 2 [Hypsibius exemplaris]
MNTHKSQEKNSAEETWHDQLRQLERKLAEEVAARKASEKEKHELQRKTSVQDVDVRQLKTQMDQMDAQYRNEVEKVRSLTKQIEALESQRASLAHEVNQANVLAESEQLTRRIAEEQMSDLHKDKTAKELEWVNSTARLQDDLVSKDNAMYQLKEQYDRRIDELVQQKEELERRLNARTMEGKRDSSVSNLNGFAIPGEEGLVVANLRRQLELEQQKKTQAINKLAEVLNMLAPAERQLELEQQKKTQAVNKLEEVMNMRAGAEPSQGGITGRARKVSSVEQRKKDKEIRKLQQEIQQDRQQFSQKIEKLQKDLNDAQASLNEESMAKLTLQMELDSKDAENEQLRGRLKTANFDTVSQNSGSGGFEDEENEIRFEGWLSVPNQRNARRLGYWKKQYVIVSSKKILFYDSKTDKANSTPNLVLDMSKLFHVRSVIKTDVPRADDKDIPLIFQLLYAGEGEARKPDDISTHHTNVQDSTSIFYKHHDLSPITFQMPTTCEACNKPLWHILRPPPAYECKLNVDNAVARASDAARSIDEQAKWITRLSKKIKADWFRCYVHQHKTSPSYDVRASVRQPYNKYSSAASLRSSTLPAHNSDPSLIKRTGV